ncbi:hypothetical protein [Maridesulfovibrio sp.]|uniref:hypothetical protein n=1 Tax=Maridesulfovibrio sp. TaxID=2795000 RepID=UPI003B0043AC
MNEIHHTDNSEQCNCSNCFFYSLWKYIKDGTNGFFISLFKYSRFILKTYRTPIILIIALLVLSITAFQRIYETIGGKINDISFISSMFISMSAFIFALFTTVKDWHHSFRKYMNITFYLKETPIIRAVNVPLAGEADIRPWAQQIGVQANAREKDKFRTQQRWLALFPRFEFNHQLLRRDEKIIYEVKMYLRKKPERVLEYEAETGQNGCIYWDIQKGEGTTFKTTGELKKPQKIKKTNSLGVKIPIRILEGMHSAAIDRKK